MKLWVQLREKKDKKQEKKRNWDSASALWLAAEDHLVNKLKWERSRSVDTPWSKEMCVEGVFILQKKKKDSGSLAEERWRS